MDTRKVLPLIDRIYEGALASRWPAFFDEFVKSMHVQASVLLMTDRFRRHVDLSHHSGLDPAFIEQYRSHYYRLDRWIDVLEALPAGTVRPNRLRTPAGFVRKSAFVEEWLRPQGLSAATAAVLHRTDRSSVLWITHHPRQEQSPDPWQAELLQSLLPHVDRAMQIDELLTAARSRSPRPHMLRLHHASESYDRPLSRPYLRGERREKLSYRQQQVLARAVQGMSNKIIARELSIAEGTVKAHLSAAFRVLGVRNRVETVHAVERCGITGNT